MTLKDLFIKDNIHGNTAVTRVGFICKLQTSINMFAIWVFGTLLVPDFSVRKYETVYTR